MRNDSSFSNFNKKQNRRDKSSMTDYETSNLTEEENFRALLKGVADLQSSACDINIERQGKQSCIFQEECDRTKKDDNEEENLKIIKQTTDTARLAMILIIRGLQLTASYASRKAKYFNSLSSAVSFLRGQEGLYQVPKHLLLEWERNMILIDLFTNNEGLYCNKRIAQDMFDICMETFDWLRSFANNNK
jgi:hypothetical protein